MAYDHLIEGVQSLILERGELLRHRIELTQELTKLQARCNGLAQDNLRLIRQVEDLRGELQRKGSGSYERTNDTRNRT